MNRSEVMPLQQNTSLKCDAGDCPTCTRRCLVRPGRCLDAERRLPKYPYPHPQDFCNSKRKEGSSNG